MKKISLIIFFVLIHLIGISQKTNSKLKTILPKQLSDTLCYWKGKLIPSSQVDDSLSVIFFKFTDSLKKNKPIR